MHKLSVVIITYNEEANILRCIHSVKMLADEILVVDSFSTDRTIEICNSLGCKVISHPFEGYGQQKQFGVEQAVNEWILSLDADEVVTDELYLEIKNLLKLDTIPRSGYNLPFSLFYMGRILRYSGTRNEIHLRLFDRNKAQFTQVNVHEGVEIKGRIGMLNGKVIHYSYRDLSHHLKKLNTYTTQAAEGYYAHGKTYSKAWVVIKFPISFFVFYIIRFGFLDGYPGFLWSFFAAIYGSLKVAKTIEMNEKRR